MDLPSNNKNNDKLTKLKKILLPNVVTVKKIINIIEDKKKVNLANAFFG